MTPELASAFAGYNRWMNDKVYAAAGVLTDEERRRDRNAFFRSIHATLNHLLVADRVWMGRLSGVVVAAGEIAPGITALDQELYADFGALRAARTEMDETIIAWAKTLTAEALAGPLRFVRRGTPTEVPMWHAVAQMFNHQTHHRGQTTTLLTQAGQDVGATDLYAFLREQPSARA